MSLTRLFLARAAAALLLAGGLALMGCGDGLQGAAPAGTFGGRPRWRLVREAQPSEARALTLTIRTPVQVRLRREGDGMLSLATPWRELAAGQSLRVIWGGDEEAPENLPDRPPEELAAAGRTEAHAARTRYHLADRPVNYHRLLEWSRPGHGAVQMLSALPPGKYEELPLEVSIELLTVVLSDLETGATRLRRREHRTLVHRPKTMGPEDRILVRRVFLDIAPLED